MSDNPDPAPLLQLSPLEKQVVAEANAAYFRPYIAGNLLGLFAGLALARSGLIPARIPRWAPIGTVWVVGEMGGRATGRAAALQLLADKLPPESPLRTRVSGVSGVPRSPSSPLQMPANPYGDSGAVPDADADPHASPGLDPDAPPASRPAPANDARPGAAEGGRPAESPWDRLRQTTQSSSSWDALRRPPGGGARVPGPASGDNAPRDGDRDSDARPASFPRSREDFDERDPFQTRERVL